MCRFDLSNWWFSAGASGSDGGQVLTDGASYDFGRGDLGLKGANWKNVEVLSEANMMKSQETVKQKTFEIRTLQQVEGIGEVYHRR